MKSAVSPDEINTQPTAFNLFSTTGKNTILMVGFIFSSGQLQIAGINCTKGRTFSWNCKTTLSIFNRFATTYSTIGHIRLVQYGRSWEMCILKIRIISSPMSSMCGYGCPGFNFHKRKGNKALRHFLLSLHNCLLFYCGNVPWFRNDNFISWNTAGQSWWSWELPFRESVLLQKTLFRAWKNVHLH